MSMRTLGAAMAAAACVLSSSALAQDAQQETAAVTVSADSSSSSGPPPAASHSNGADPGKLRILGGLHFGGGGEVHVDPEGPGSAEADLRPLVGLQAGVDYVLMEYFALGGELRLTWWKPDDNDLGAGDVGRSMFFDIDVKPRGRYQFRNIPLEVYGTLPMGLSIAAINDDLNMDGGAGFNLGLGAGATYFFTSRLGVNAEMLGVWHWFDGEINGVINDVDTDNRAAQFYFMINGVFAI